MISHTVCKAATLGIKRISYLKSIVQEWTDIEVLDLGEEYSRGAIRGRRKLGLDEGGGFQEEFSYAVPCSLSEVLSFQTCVVIFLLCTSEANQMNRVV